VAVPFELPQGDSITNQRQADEQADRD